MQDQRLIDEVLTELISMRGRWPTPAEYPAWIQEAEQEAERIEAENRRNRISAMLDEVYAMVDILAGMETLAEEDDVDGFNEGRIEACQAIFDRLDVDQRKLIWDSRRKLRSRDPLSGSGDTFTEERKLELDQTVEYGRSGIYGMRLRARDGWKDRGNYAGKVCLITRHGWAPIVVPGGVDELLRRLGIWGKYEDKWPSNSKQVPFDRGDRFDVEWERLEDGTRSFVKVAAY